MKRGTLIWLLILLNCCSVWGQKWSIPINNQIINGGAACYDTSVFLTGGEQPVGFVTGVLTKYSNHGSKLWKKYVHTGVASNVMDIASVDDGFILALVGCTTDTSTCGIIIAKVNHCYEEVWSIMLEVENTEGVNKIYPLANGDVIVSIYLNRPLYEGLMRVTSDGKVKWITSAQSDDINYVLADETTDEIYVSGSVYLPYINNPNIKGVRAYFLTLNLTTGAIKDYFVLHHGTDSLSSGRGLLKANDTFFYWLVTDQNRGIEGGYARLLIIDNAGRVHANEIIGDTTIGCWGGAIFFDAQKNINIHTEIATNRNSDDEKQLFYKITPAFQTLKEKLYGNNDSVIVAYIFFKGVDSSYFLYNSLNSKTTPYRRFLMKIDDDMEWMDFGPPKPASAYDFKCPLPVTDDTIFLHPVITAVNIDSNSNIVRKPLILSNNTQAKTNQNFIVYPNPFNATITISSVSNTTVLIYNANGELLIKTDTIGETTIDVSKLTQGVYYIKSVNLSGVFVKKIIKQ